MNILAVDDDARIRRSLQHFLQELGHTVTVCADAAEALQAFTTGDYPLVVSDVKMPGISGIELLKQLRTLPRGNETDVVLITGHDDVTLAVEAMRAGARDYLLKPLNIEELAVITDQVAEHQNLIHENRRLREKDACLQEAADDARREVLRLRQLVGQTAGLGSIGVFSATMQKLLAEAEAYHLDRSIPVLIQGETGSGKEILARLVHFGQKNPTPEVPLVDINCAAMTASLFESELFGYDPGSFTGSLSKGQKGKLDLAAGGSLFLDEVGDLLPELQAKLLRVIQEKEFYRVGGLKKIPVDVRIICATNANLTDKVADGSFRRDLYYRLSVACLNIPPLRQRREEILPLALMFLQELALQKKKSFQCISPAAAQILENHNWPGNVRELKNTMELATVLFDGIELHPAHIILPSVAVTPLAAPSFPDNRTAVLNPEQFYLPEQGFSLDGFMDHIIAAALEKHHGNKSATAAYLGLTRRTLSYRLDRNQGAPGNNPSPDSRHS
ncbi:MAG TPA: sigma-54 dependent transcriptional regulator [Patescibacteria group bacterium]|nr:sigma-54 dependent transcriptional regulator [Patescibacteria group bacterium]